MCVYDARKPQLAFLNFFFNDTATTEIYTLSLHDALPIFSAECLRATARTHDLAAGLAHMGKRSEEHTSELQSRVDLVCRLRLEEKKNHYNFGDYENSTDRVALNRHGDLTW